MSGFKEDKMHDVDDLIYGRQGSPLLVIGGTPKNSSHRMVEKGEDLEPVHHHIEVAVAEFIEQAETLDILEEVITKLFEEDTHFVGTKNHVYNSKQMKRVLGSCRDAFYFSIWLPRTLGFREKALKLLKETDDVQTE